MENLDNSLSLYHPGLDKSKRRMTLPDEFTLRNEINCISKKKKLSIPNYEAEATENIAADSDWKEFTSNTTFHGIKYIFYWRPAAHKKVN